MLTIEALKSDGGLCLDQRKKDTIEWNIQDENGNEKKKLYEVWVRKLSYGEMERAVKSESYTAAMISAGIRLGEKGDEAFDYDMALSLDLILANQLITAVHKFNGAKTNKEEKEPGKESPPMTDSGVI